ncbi:unnamed protein product [Parnassius apollo]|uniref:(apollo) hypothetical protein n=1 Tax=Parnassius apollo TaxID=110799 RepID=A0A8S3W2J5_PARAO|nr:unnamed protein product [Parnassius apollo]
MNSYSGWRAVHGLKSRGGERGEWGGHCAAAGARHARAALSSAGARPGDHTARSPRSQPSPPLRFSDDIDVINDSMPFDMRLDHLLQIAILTYLFIHHHIHPIKIPFLNKGLLTRCARRRCAVSRGSCAGAAPETKAPACSRHYSLAVRGGAALCLVGHAQAPRLRPGLQRAAGSQYVPAGATHSLCAAALRCASWIMRRRRAYDQASSVQQAVSACWRALLTRCARRRCAAPLGSCAGAAPATRAPACSRQSVRARGRYSLAVRGSAALRLLDHAQAPRLRPGLQRAGRCGGRRRARAVIRSTRQLHATLGTPATNLIQNLRLSFFL